MTITYGSVCSGIEAATEAWHPAGWRAEWYVEIEPTSGAMLAHLHHANIARAAMFTTPGKIQ